MRYLCASMLRKFRHASTPLALVLSFTVPPFAFAEQFIRHELSRDFYSEGGTCADVDNDGHIDVLAGPFVYYGPDFTMKSTIYEPKPYSIIGYSNNFLVYAHDVNNDGFSDLLVYDFPGAQAWYFQNPGANVRSAQEWGRHVALETADNESPLFTDVTGDGKPELVCCHGGQFGYAEIPADPTQVWKFTPVSENNNYQRFTHGIGVGDVNDDGQPDMLAAHGWWENPGHDGVTGDGDRPLWNFHAQQFAGGSAQMYAVDFSGDGKTEVVSSLNAHGYGLVMYVKELEGDEYKWTAVPIMTDSVDTSPTGLAISQLHAVEIADMDNNGVPDIVTGKRFWAHQGHDVGENEPVHLVWFEPVRRGENVFRFLPHIVDSDSGVGTQITPYDINKDGKVDLFSASKRGVHVFIQTTDDDPAGNVSLAVAQDQQFKTPVESYVKIDDTLGGFRPAADDQTPLNFDFEEGTLADWRGSGGAFFKQPVKGDTVSARRNDMPSNLQGDFWIGTFEIVDDIGQGTLESRSFKLTQPFASFLVGGGSEDTTRVEIVDLSTGEVLATQTGADTETMKRAVLDLSTHQGKSVFIRLVDKNAEGWGHLNFDDFRLHESAPKVADKDRLTKLDVIEHESLSPDQVAAAMKLPSDFHVQVIAAEPDVQQPVAMTIDERGRMWVIEAYEYPTRKEGDKGKDRILILEDTDQDGSLDKRRVFYEGLNLATGIEVGFGGVWVGAAPYLYFFPDRDSNDIPDQEPIVELDGWGWHDTHETLNSFIWGPDGWLYGCHGVFTHSNVGKKGASDAERQRINAGIWRYHPIEKKFEVFAHGTSNPWGVDFDSRGQCFLTACVIPHLFHVIPGARYHRQAGQHFDEFTYDDIKTIARHRHWIGDNPHAGNNRSDDAGGGHAHSGAMIYQGGSWPEQYHDQIFMNNIHGARLNQDKLVRDGSGYYGDRAPDFLFANDRSSQILYFRYGADGQVYAIDWYDIQQCHTGNAKDHDRGNGRIYRISYKDQSPVRVNLNTWSDAELVKALANPNQWYVRTARRILQERSYGNGNADAVQAVRKMMHQPDSVISTLNALWTLAACNVVTADDVKFALSNDDEYVRSWGIRIAMENLKGDSQLALVNQWSTLATNDPSQAVRLSLASACQALPSESATAILKGLVRHEADAADHNLPLMYWYATSRVARENPALALSIVAESKIDLVNRYCIRQLSTTDQGPSIEAAVEFLTHNINRADAPFLLNELLAGLSTRKEPHMPKAWPALRDKVLNSENGEIKQAGMMIAAKFRDEKAISMLRSLALDKSQDLAGRQHALSTLRQIKDNSLTDIATALLEESPLRIDAIAALAADLDAARAQSLISQMREWDSETRRNAIYAMTRRGTTAETLWQAIQEKTVGVNEISADMVEQLSQLKDFTSGEAFKAKWSESRQSVGEAEKQIAALKSMIESHDERRDAAEGKSLFTKTCGQCHQLFGEGGKIGPELTGSNRKDLNYLLSNIVSPSAVMAKEYQPWIVQTEEGQVITGILKSKSDASIVLQTPTELVTIYQEDIAGMKQSEQSMMPENLLGTLNDSQVRALVGYLQSDGK